MIPEDFHVHTTWCDGRDEAETIVKRAVELGMTRLGFSGHAHTPCDESYCMSPENTLLYRREIESLRVKYADRIAILDHGTIAETGEPETVLREDLLSEVYGTPVRVLRDPREGLIILPAMPRGGAEQR